MWDCVSPKGIAPIPLGKVEIPQPKLRPSFLSIAFLFDKQCISSGPSHHQSLYPSQLTSEWQNQTTELLDFHSIKIQF